MTTPQIELYSLPFDDRTNRYFALWRAALERTGRVQARPVPPGGLLRLAFSRNRKDKHRLLVIHWSTVLYGSRFALKSLLQLAMNAGALLLLKMRGWTIFWVMHNAAAHDYPHPRIDRLGRALVRSCADAVIVHQESTRKAFANAYARPRVTHIPLGHYKIYGDRLTDQKSARVRYGFGPQDKVFLALGMIRPYKRLEEIIDAFDKAPRHPSSPAKLWIVGKGDPGYVESLRRRSGSTDIRIENRFIPDEEIPAVLATASYSPFFFDDSELTSSGVILSLSYGVPIISRRIPAAEMALEGKSGFFFESVEGLSELMGRLSEMIPPTPEQVLESVELPGWDSIARSYIALYDSLYD